MKNFVLKLYKDCFELASGQITRKRLAFPCLPVIKEKIPKRIMLVILAVMAPFECPLTEINVVMIFCRM